MAQVIWIALAGFTAIWIADVSHEERVKTEAFDKAVSLSKDKGIVNLGATGAWIVSTTKRIARHPTIKVNVDIRTDDTPKFMRWDLENIPYPFRSKEFDVAFCAHILEHLENWDEALVEWQRIADNVIVVLPVPYLHGWFSPDHKQHFSHKDIEGMKAEYPEVEIYY